jgi:hypothetical protein
VLIFAGILSSGTAGVVGAGGMTTTGAGAGGSGGGGGSAGAGSATAAGGAGVASAGAAGASWALTLAAIEIVPKQPITRILRNLPRSKCNRMFSPSRLVNAHFFRGRVVVRVNGISRNFHLIEDEPKSTRWL